MLAAAGGSGIALAGEIGARVPPPDGGGPAGSPSSVLVEVDQVATGVVEHRVHAAVLHPGRLPDEHPAVGLEPFGVTPAVVGVQREHRPADGPARLPERPAAASGRCSPRATPHTPGGTLRRQTAA